MPLAALLTWIMTAAGGLYLLTIWLIEYDREFQSVAATRLPVPVISSHALLAVTGLVLWAIYLITDIPGLDWLVAAILGVVAILGLTMAARWIGVYRAYGSRSRRARVPVAVPVGAGAGGYVPPRATGWPFRPNAISRCQSSSCMGCSRRPPSSWCC